MIVYLSVHDIVLVDVPIQHCVLYFHSALLRRPDSRQGSEQPRRIIERFRLPSGAVARDRVQCTFPARILRGWIHPGSTRISARRLCRRYPHWNPRHRAVHESLPGSVRQSIGQSRGKLHRRTLQEMAH